jgi:hypothetical protein
MDQSKQAAHAATHPTQGKRLERTEGGGGKALALTLLGLCLLAGCKKPFDEAGAVASGREAVAPFKRELQATLSTAMAKGPAEAIEVCRGQAPGIAKRVARPGTRLGRTSARLRNGQNTAPSWVAPLMNQLAAEKPESAVGASPSPSPSAPSVPVRVRAVALPDGRAGYVEAIRVQPLCLTCHGKSIEPAVQQQLTAAYPQDDATGYELGDFRGVFWAELPAPSADTTPPPPPAFPEH